MISLGLLLYPPLSNYCSSSVSRNHENHETHENHEIKLWEPLLIKTLPLSALWSFVSSLDVPLSSGMRPFLNLEHQHCMFILQSVLLLWVAMGGKSRALWGVVPPYTTIGSREKGTWQKITWNFWSPLDKGTEKAHKLFQPKLFGPNPKSPILGPQKKVDVASFHGKERKKGTHINFSGRLFGVKKGVPNGPFLAPKSLVYCFFLPLWTAGCPWDTWQKWLFSGSFPFANNRKFPGHRPVDPLFVPPVSENSRRLWLSEIPCWKSFPTNFDAAGKFFTDSPAARNAIPARVWALSGKENGCWKIGPTFGNAPGFSPLRPPQPSWVFLTVGQGHPDSIARILFNLCASFLQDTTPHMLTIVDNKLGVQKLTRPGLNGVSKRDVWKDKFAFFEAYKNPIPKWRNLLAKRPFL